LGSPSTGERERQRDTYRDRNRNIDGDRVTRREADTDRQAGFEREEESRERGGTFSRGLNRVTLEARGLSTSEQFNWLGIQV